MSFNNKLKKHRNKRIDQPSQLRGPLVRRLVDVCRKLQIFISETSVKAIVVSNDLNIEYEFAMGLRLIKNDFNHRELSSENIWETVVECITNTIRKYTHTVRFNMIQFHAVNALVVVQMDGTPVTVSKSGDSNQNVILWMDNRAVTEYDRFLNLSEDIRNDLKQYIHIPNLAKILWIKKNLPIASNQFRKLRFLNLEQFLYFKCFQKFDSFSEFNEICDRKKINRILGKLEYSDLCADLDDLVNYRYFQIKTDRNYSLSILDQHNKRHLPIEFIFGYNNIKNQPRTKVHPFDFSFSEIIKINRNEQNVSYVNNQDTLYFNQSINSIFITNGVEMISGRDTLNNNCQLLKELEISSYCCGGKRSLIDFIVRSHTEYTKINNSSCKNKTIEYLKNYVKLNEDDSLSEWVKVTESTANIHIIPDLERNTFMFRELDQHGMSFGVKLMSTETNFLTLYLAILHSLAYSYRTSLEELKIEMSNIETIEYYGYYSDNHTFLQTLADVLERKVWNGPSDPHRSISSLYRTTIFNPCTKCSSFHTKKYKVFMKMQELKNKCNLLLNMDYH